jgi:hypothetical protein
VLEYLGDIILDIDDETVRQMREALEHNVHQTQIDPQLTNIILQQFEGIDVEVRKEAVVRALIAFTWTQRLYFIVRSAIMGLMGAGVTAIVVFLLGKVDAFQVVIISVMSFIVTLAITRLLDAQISQGSKQIILRLSQHRRLRAVILGHF